MISTAIVLFVYKRKDKVEKLIDSLKNCPESKNSELVVFSDEAINDESRNSVDEVRAYIDKINCFKSIDIIKRNENFGIEKNEIDGITRVLEKYDSVIVLEDDLVVAPDFLNYMYTALEKYKGCNGVSSVIAYSYFDMKKMNKRTLSYEKLPDYGFIRQCCSWGWGTWKNRWEVMRHPITQDDIDKLYSLHFSKSFDNGNIYSHMMISMFHQNKITWDMQWYFRCFENEWLNLMPKHTYVNNVGKDGTGVHYISKTDCNDKNILERRKRGVLPDVVVNDYKYQKEIKKCFIVFTGGRWRYLKRQIRGLFRL